MKLKEIAPYPLTFAPLLKTKVWGGRRLVTMLGKPCDHGDPVGESWELVDLPGDQSVVANGPAASATLGEIVVGWGYRLLGHAPLDGGHFPLLVKYIDASEHLSIQVHPDGAAARKLGGRPKSEAWFILDAEPGAKIYVGLKRGTRRDDLAQAITEDRVVELVNAIEVEAGDMIPVRPGTVHAIGAGVLLAEVQQPSDTTFRIHDWGRVGLDGKPRDLHVNEALRSTHFHRHTTQLMRSGGVDVGLFHMQLAQLSDGESMVLDHPGPAVVVGLTGEVWVESDECEPLPVVRGGTVLVPDACRDVQVQGKLPENKVVLVTFPES